MPTNGVFLPILNENKLYFKPVIYSRQYDEKEIHANNTQIVLPPINPQVNYEAKSGAYHPSPLVKWQNVRGIHPQTDQSVQHHKVIEWLEKNRIPVMRKLPRLDPLVLTSRGSNLSKYINFIVPPPLAFRSLNEAKKPKGYDEAREYEKEYCPRYQRTLTSQTHLVPFTPIVRVGGGFKRLSLKLGNDLPFVGVSEQELIALIKCCVCSGDLAQPEQAVESNGRTKTMFALPRYCPHCGAKNLISASSKKSKFKNESDMGLGDDLENSTTVMKTDSSEDDFYIARDFQRNIVFVTQKGDPRFCSGSGVTIDTAIYQANYQLSSAGDDVEDGSLSSSQQKIKKKKKRTKEGQTSDSLVSGDSKKESKRGKFLAGRTKDDIDHHQTHGNNENAEQSLSDDARAYYDGYLADSEGEAEKRQWAQDNSENGKKRQSAQMRTMNGYSDVNDYVTPDGTTHARYLERKAYSAHHMQKGQRASLKKSSSKKGMIECAGFSCNTCSAHIPGCEGTCSTCGTFCQRPEGACDVCTGVEERSSLSAVDAAMKGGKMTDFNDLGSDYDGSSRQARQNKTATKGSDVKSGQSGRMSLTKATKKALKVKQIVKSKRPSKSKKKKKKSGKKTMEPDNEEIEDLPVKEEEEEEEEEEEVEEKEEEEEEEENCIGQVKESQDEASEDSVDFVEQPPLEIKKEEERKPLIKFTKLKERKPIKEEKKVIEKKKEEEEKKPAKYSYLHLLKEQPPKVPQPNRPATYQKVRGVQRVNVAFRERAELVIRMKKIMDPAMAEIICEADLKTRRDSNIDFMAQYRLVDKSKLEKYGRAFALEDDDEDDILSYEEMLVALEGVPTVDGMSRKQLKYVLQVLEVGLTSRVTFKMFAVLTALCERVLQLDRYVKEMVEGLDFAEVEWKMDMYKNMFYFTGDRSVNYITTDDLRIELKAGGLNQQQEDNLIRHILLGKTNTQISFLEYMAYIPLFITIHSNICDNALDMSRDKFKRGPPIT